MPIGVREDPDLLTLLFEIIQAVRIRVIESRQAFRSDEMIVLQSCAGIEQDDPFGLVEPAPQITSIV